MMLGARTAAWAKSGGGAPTARDYVQDGLIAMWDGIENAGWGVHDQNATVWKDLIGDIDIQILNGGRFTDNSLERDPAGNEIAYTPGNVSDIVTLEGVFFSADVNGTHSIFSLANSQGVYERYFFQRDDYMWFCRYSKRCKFITGKANSISCVFDGGTSVKDVMVNGVSVSLDKGNDWWYPLSVSVGYYNGYGASLLDGYVNCIRGYSMELPKARRIKNYLIDKARFNLT